MVVIVRWGETKQRISCISRRCEKLTQDPQDTKISKPKKVTHSNTVWPLCTVSTTRGVEFSRQSIYDLCASEAQIFVLLSGWRAPDSDIPPLPLEKTGQGMVCTNANTQHSTAVRSC
jgi:hypothetical protein